MTDPLAGFSPVVDLLDRIVESGNNFPRVRLAFGETDAPLVLTRAGDKARAPGSVNLTDGGSYGQNVWFGRISTDGVFAPSHASKALGREDKTAMWSLLTRLRNGEAETVFAEFGHKFGTCCLCGRELTNPESVRLGIGPVCRSKAF